MIFVTVWFKGRASREGDFNDQIEIDHITPPLVLSCSTWLSSGAFRMADEGHTTPSYFFAICRPLSCEFKVAYLSSRCVGVRHSTLTPSPSLSLSPFLCPNEFLRFFLSLTRLAVSNGDNKSWSESQSAHL